MTFTVQQFVRTFWQEHGPLENCLDIGAYNVNGSVKNAISGYKKFTGIDMRPGPGVDLVLNAHNLDTVWKEPTFDFVSCCEMIEHDLMFWKTKEQIDKVLKVGGWFLLTSVFIFAKHDYPSDYYRFTKEAFEDFFFAGFDKVRSLEYTYTSGEISTMCYGQKVK
jgi:hypothetical protein